MSRDENTFLLAVGQDHTAYCERGSFEEIKADVPLYQFLTVFETGRIAEDAVQDPKGRDPDQAQVYIVVGQVTAEISDI